MNGKVFIINDRAPIARKMLEEQGFEVIVGDGTLSAERMAGCFGLMSGRAVITREFLEQVPDLKIISKQGVGVDRIDVEACSEKGIVVTNTPLSNYIAVAEHTMALILSLAKQICPASNGFKKDVNVYSKAGKMFSALELYNKNLSIVGLGHIGLRVAELAHGFGMNIYAYVRHPEGKNIPSYITLTDSMDDVVSIGDIVTMHVSGTENNRGLFGKHQFDLMKDGALFINTTRGFVVDEEAMIKALREGKIAGAGLDVFADEPAKQDNELLLMDNVVTTPHIAANTKESRERAVRECAKSIIDYSRGIMPESVVNPRF